MKKFVAMNCLVMALFSSSVTAKLRESAVSPRAQEICTENNGEEADQFCTPEKYEFVQCGKDANSAMIFHVPTGTICLQLPEFGKVTMDPLFRLRH